MLDTVLQIGKAFRSSPTGLKHHRYVKPCPQDTDKRKILRLSIPVRKDFTFNFDAIEEITDENKIRDKLFYLTFKTSDADSLVKYIFGDIYYTPLKGNEDGGGYYRMANLQNKQKAYHITSFHRGQENFREIEGIYQKNLVSQEIPQNQIETKLENFILKRFRNEYKKNIELIERILLYQCGIQEYLQNRSDHGALTKILSDEELLKKLTAKHVYSNLKQSKTANKTIEKILGVQDPLWEAVEFSEEWISKLSAYSTGNLFLHFDFHGKQWYEYSTELKIINHKILEDFVEPSKTGNGYILKKYLYKTLSSAKKDLQFPTFRAEARYRNKTFAKPEDIMDLVYAVDYSKKESIRIPFSSIKIIVLPKGENLTAENFENFGKGTISVGNLDGGLKNQEVRIKEDNVLESEDILFTPLISNVVDEIIQFDLVFCKESKGSSPDVDVIEISGIDKSYLREIDRRIKIIKRSIYGKRAEEIKTKLKPIGISQSFVNILGDTTAEKKKYQSHIFKVLPQIYTGIYYNDPILLPRFVEKTEENIRGASKKKFNFNLLKYDFYFLTQIQNTQKKGEHLMNIKNSKSYKIGLLLGELAQQFAAWRNDCPIKSFEKSYVGTLSRRITTMAELLKFKTFIEEKLVLHERSKFTFNASQKLTEAIKELEASSEEKYDRHRCSFGFFESYFSTAQNKKEKDQPQALEAE